MQVRTLWFGCDKRLSGTVRNSHTELLYWRVFPGVQALVHKPRHSHWRTESTALVETPAYRKSRDGNTASRGLFRLVSRPRVCPRKRSTLRDPPIKQVSGLLILAPASRPRKTRAESWGKTQQARDGCHHPSRHFKPKEE